MADDLRDLFKWQFGDDMPRRGGSGSSGGGTGGEGKSDPNANPYESTGENENRAPRALNEKEVKVMGIWGTLDPEHPDKPPKQMFVLLRDNRGRKAPIYIGSFETVAIQMSLENTPSERPSTHDLLKSMIDRLGGSIDRVTIDDIWQQTYYARITITMKDGTVQDIDSRPSDAIALALRAKAPIYMAEDVIESAGRDDDDE